MHDDDDLPGVQTRVLTDKGTVADVAAALILDAAEAAISARGRFRLCLAGGTTPTAAYRKLASAHAEWSAWNLYHGDERCLPVQDAERNSLAADEAWLSLVPVPRGQVFPIPAELGAEAGADAYEPVARAALPFDLVLLGIGEDGHTASLFPGHSIAADRLVMPVHDAPKPPPDRVSLTPVALCDSDRVLILATGSGKAEAIARWRAGEALPVARVAQAARALVLLDRAAAGY